MSTFLKLPLPTGESVTLWHLNFSHVSETRGVIRKRNFTVDGGETENDDKVFENFVKNGFLSNSLLAFSCYLSTEVFKKFICFMDLTNNAVRIPFGEVGDKVWTEWNCSREDSVSGQISTADESGESNGTMLDSRTVTQTSTRPTLAFRDL